MSFLTQRLWKKNKVHRSDSLFPRRCEDGLGINYVMFCEETENIVYIFPGNATVIMTGASIDALVIEAHTSRGIIMTAELNSDFCLTFEFFISSFISIWVFFSGSTSLLNFMFISWIVFIISPYCFFMILVKAFIHILFNVLECIHTCNFEVPVLCLS